MNLFPTKVAPYAKAWVAFAGMLASALVLAWDTAPDWLVIVTSVLTTAGVYLTPNAEHDPRHA